MTIRQLGRLILIAAGALFILYGLSQITNLPQLSGETDIVDFTTMILVLAPIFIPVLFGLFLIFLASFVAKLIWPNSFAAEVTSINRVQIVTIIFSVGGLYLVMDALFLLIGVKEANTISNMAFASVVNHSAIIQLIIGLVLFFLTGIGLPSLYKLLAFKVSGQHVGTVDWFDRKKKYGFITTQDGDHIFVHYKDILDEPDFLKPDESVSYSIINAEKGKQAVKVKRI